MASLDKVIASLFSISNEATASLVSAKVDFSLFRFEAPPEFAQVGPSLSRSRLAEAETGATHKTARRLAALFEQLTPNTPKLVSAYGTRVSQIITRPAINTPGSKSHGPFEAYAGTDATALWASATSGTSAIGMYLLACLLARAWQHKHAVSIWVELIEERKKAIRAGFDRNEAVSEASLVSTLQEISRDDIAHWDSSARAWLRSADQAKSWQMKQLELVTKEINLPFCPGTSPFHEVISTWTRAMLGIEDLLSGLPQEISDASILLAFSAWHLFPDLLVLANAATKVPFHDTIFQNSAVATIGVLPSKESTDRGIKWSLALSHLQHYGPKIDVQSTVSQARVTFVQFRMVILGCVFEKWRLNHREYLQAAQFISGLWELLVEGSRGTNTAPVEDQLGWLYLLFQASNDLLLAQRAKPVVLDDYLKLVAYGARRGQDFLCPRTDSLKPFFGLCDDHIIGALGAGNARGERSIKYLRSIAERSGLSPEDGIIALTHYETQGVKQFKPLFHEFASIAPCPTKTKKRDSSGTVVVDQLFARWFDVHLGKESAAKDAIEARKHYVVLKGEIAASVNSGNSTCAKSHDTWIWKNPPRIFTLRFLYAASQFNGQTSESCKEAAFDATWTQNYGDGDTGQRVRFERASGLFHCGLYLREPKQLVSTHVLTPIAALQGLKDGVSSHSLWEYMSDLARNSWGEGLETAGEIDTLTVANSSRLTHATCMSLHALSRADEVFAHISSPTISLGCLDYPMWQVSWMPDQAEANSNIPQSLNRQQTFACIAFFDSGNLNLDPEHLKSVIALSNENSIYVAGIALSDPSTPLPENEVRHIFGNIGRKGMSLLVAPKEPRIRPLSKDYRVVTHAPYDHMRENSFEGTTLHLSFTPWQPPLSQPGQDRTIDDDVFYVESVISVRERGEWVADLDIMSIDFPSLYRVPSTDRARCNCSPESKQAFVDENVDIVSVDSWNEFLDAPRATGIFRAHGNWAARLAALSIMYQQGQGHSVAIMDKGYTCLKCLSVDRDFGGLGSRSYESGLPSMCID